MTERISPTQQTENKLLLPMGVGVGGVGIWDQQVKLSYAERRNTVLPQSPGSSAVCWADPWWETVRKRTLDINYTPIHLKKNI